MVVLKTPRAQLIAALNILLPRSRDARLYASPRGADWPATVRFSDVIVRMCGRAETCFPPFHLHGLHREVEGSPVELLGQLRDRDDPLGEAVIVHVTRDLDSRVASSSAPVQLLPIA